MGYTVLHLGKRSKAEILLMLLGSWPDTPRRQSPCDLEYALLFAHSEAN